MFKRTEPLLPQSFRKDQIFEVSVNLHGDKAKEEEVVVDSTVQEKNITFPTDTKQLTKIVTRCHIMAKLENVKLWRSYQREIKKLLRTIRFKSKGRKQSEAERAIRRLRIIANVVIRDMRRKLSQEALEIHRQSLGPRLRCLYRSHNHRDDQIHLQGHRETQNG